MPRELSGTIPEGSGLERRHIALHVVQRGTTASSVQKQQTHFESSESLLAQTAARWQRS